MPSLSQYLPADSAAVDFSDINVGSLIDPNEIVLEDESI